MEKSTYLPLGGKILAAAILAASLAACSSSSGTDPVQTDPPTNGDTTPPPSNGDNGDTTPPPSERPEADLEMGAVQYETYCVGCHGEDGLGNISVNLADGLPDGYTDLVRYVEETMPIVTGETHPSDCAETDNCAINTAAYMQSWPVATEMADGGYHIESIETCAAFEPSGDNALVFEDENIGNVTGWNNIGTGDPWTGLALEPTSELYNVPGVVEADPTCDGIQTQNTIIVKKYADWAIQHANGFEVQLSAYEQSFADVESIILEFKVNSENTHLYNPEELQAIYGDLLSEDQYAELDGGRAVFAVTLRQSEDVAIEERVSAERYIVIEPALMDRWLRVTIPVDNMEFFTGHVYQKNAAPEGEELANIEVDNIHIVGETLGNRTELTTTYGDVIRNFLGGPGDAEWAEMDVEETFKEMDITVKRLELLWR